MAQDLITLTALSRELDANLRGARISKIYQPSDDELLFRVRKNGDRTLLISTNPNLSRIHFTEEKYENPQSSPAFCMLLRKYLTGAIVDGVSLYNADRIIVLKLINTSEMKDKTVYRLLFESFGRYANLILLKDDMTVVDALKRIYPDVSDRTILPNVIYPEQPHNRIRLDDEKAVAEYLSDCGNANAELRKSLSGINKLTEKEIEISEDKFVKLQSLLNVYGSGNYAPCLYSSLGANGILPCPYESLGTPDLRFENLSDCYDFYYKKQAAEDKKRRDTKELKTIIKRLKEKTVSKIEECEKIAKNEEIIEKYRRFGELILANLHSASMQNSIIKCYDYYNNTDIEIPADANLDLKKNSEAYFKKYKKAKHAKEVAETLLAECRNTLSYIADLEASVLTSDNEKEYAEILDELYNLLGRNRNKKSVKKKKESPSAPLKTNVGGFTVYVGKNSRQNDEVTFKIARGNDIWLHVKNYHGSHTVVITEGRSVPKDVIYEAARIAAHYSEAKDSDKVEVDYTERRNVRRSGKFAGMVNYTDYKTVVVDKKPR